MLALLATLALQRGAADLLAFGARRALDRGGFPSAEAAGRARARLEQARGLDSGNAEHCAYLARWHEAAAQYREALVQYRGCVSQRPAWPYGWLDLARMKLAAGEFDNELDRAVRNAARFGPWEPGVQLALAEILVTDGHRLSAEARQAAFALLGNALKRQEREVAALMAARGRLDLLCAIPGIGAHRAGLRCI
jgi:cytochrome c-type biogenesis protein CcmH/NrfG